MLRSISPSRETDGVAEFPVGGFPKAAEIAGTVEEFLAVEAANAVGAERLAVETEIEFLVETVGTS